MITATLGGGYVWPRLRGLQASHSPSAGYQPSQWMWGADGTCRSDWQGNPRFELWPGVQGKFVGSTQFAGHKCQVFIDQADDDSYFPDKYFVRNGKPAGVMRFFGDLSTPRYTLYYSDFVAGEPPARVFDLPGFCSAPE